MPTITVELQMGGPSKLVHSNPENDDNLPAPVIPGASGATGVSWLLENGSLVTIVKSGDEGKDATFTPASPGSTTGQIQAKSLSNVLVTHDLVVNVAPPPVNELTHFAPTIEEV